MEPKRLREAMFMIGDTYTESKGRTVTVVSVEPFYIKVEFSFPTGNSSFVTMGKSDLEKILHKGNWILTGFGTGLEQMSKKTERKKGKRKAYIFESGDL